VLQVNKAYPEATTYKLIYACRDVLNLSNEELMRELGADFHPFITNYDYHKVALCLSIFSNVCVSDFARARPYLSRVPKRSGQSA
jgi:hypothetical protein